MYVYNKSMLVIVKFKNIKFYIYPNDHGNPHVHVVGPGAQAKIFIEDLEVISSKGFSKKALGQIVEQVEIFKETLIEVWEEYHEEE